MTCVYRTTWELTVLIKNSSCDITGAYGSMLLRSVRCVCPLHAGYTRDKRGTYNIGKSGVCVVREESELR